MQTNPSQLTLAEIRDGISTKKYSAQEVTDAFLSNVRERDGHIGAFLAVDEQGARAGSRALDERVERGEALPSLAGAVIAVKDNICVAGLPATAASKILEGYRPSFDATVIERLREHGAIVIGKTNLDEFAMGASTEQSAYRLTRNPHDPKRVPGGSSGGSAAAVAAGFSAVALGSDTGGSIRQPAAFCGLVGFRPTYGSVSRYGLLALTSSMDVIGPLARSVADARDVYRVIAGYDPRDATSLPPGVVETSAAAPGLRGVRVGIPREYSEETLDPAVAAAFERSRRVLESAGARVVELSLPSTRFAVPAYYVITPAEAASNLARYDGLRFGPAAPAATGHGQATAALRGERFGLEPKRRILLGSFVLSAGYSDRYYHTAQRVRTLIRQDFSTAFHQVDLLLTPATPTPAFPIGSVADPVSMYRQDIFLAAASLAGVPALTLPVPGTGLPVGVQLIGRQGTDFSLLDRAESLERELAG